MAVEHVISTSADIPSSVSMETSLDDFTTLHRIARLLLDKGNIYKSADTWYAAETLTEPSTPRPELGPTIVGYRLWAFDENPSPNQHPLQGIELDLRTGQATFLSVNSDVQSPVLLCNKMVDAFVTELPPIKNY